MRQRGGDGGGEGGGGQEAKAAEAQAPARVGKLHRNNALQPLKFGVCKTSAYLVGTILLAQRALKGILERGQAVHRAVQDTPVQLLVKVRQVCSKPKGGKA